jgi:hypothetical protein
MTFSVVPESHGLSSHGVEMNVSPVEKPNSDEPRHSALVAAHIVYGLHSVAIVPGITAI